MKRLPVAISAVLALSLLSACSANSRSSSPNDGSSSSIPSVTSARYVGFSVPGYPPNPDNLVALEDAARVQATAVSFYMSLGKKLDISAISSLRSSGTLPIVEIDSDKISLREITVGTEDPVLRSYAKQIASVRGTVAVDFDHEFNGPWFEWGYTHESAVTFVAAWRHVVTIFRRSGATNVAWIWNPNVSSSSTTPIIPWYPGDAWVTMVGLDGYFYTPQATFGSVFGPTLSQVRNFTHHPVFIMETGANPSAHRAAQINDLFAGARKAGIVGVIWFDYHKYTSHNWSINNDPAALAAFRKAAEAYQ
jgi:Glycosyl hydrolase family 26